MHGSGGNVFASVLGTNMVRVFSALVRPGLVRVLKFPVDECPLQCPWCLSFRVATKALVFSALMRPGARP